MNIDLAFSPLLPQIKEALNSWVESGFVPESYFHVQKGDWSALEQAYNWVAQKIGTREVNATEINENNRILLRGSTTATTYQLNQKPYQPGVILKNSAYEKFLLPALEAHVGSGSLSIVSDVKVDRVLWQENTAGAKVAQGVKLSFTKPLAREDVNASYLVGDYGQSYEIHAKNIILCAGALGSPEILLRSELDNPNIGKGIVLHPSMGIIGQFDYDINPHLGLSASVYSPAENPEDKYFFESMGDVPSFIALIHPGDGYQIFSSVKNFKKLGGFGVMLIDTSSEGNRVFIDPVSHAVQVDYTLSEQDKSRMNKALLRGVEILFAQGAKSVFIPSLEVTLNGGNPVFTSFAEAQDQISKIFLKYNFNFITSAHMQGSNKMGFEAKTSVVSHNFRVWDLQHKKEIRNLYIIDGSIFPTSVGANPMQSIYTFAKIFVDRFEP